MNFDWENDVRIDEEALDVEWLEQPDLGVRYGKYYLHLKKKAQLVHENLKYVRSKLIDKVNRDPKKRVGKDKPNAADIEAYYRRHPSYLEAKAAHIEAESERDFAELVKNEICFTRKAGLEALVTLHGQQWFAGPAVPRNLTDERKNRQREIDSRISQRMKRTK